MKRRVIIVPAVALLASGVFLFSQRLAISSIEEKTRLLTRQIPSPADPTDSTGRPQRSKPQQPASPSINWLRIAEISGERHPGILEKQELLHLDRQLQAMSTAELLASLEQIRSLNLDIRSRGDIETKILRILRDKDPAAALDHLADRRNHHVGLSIRYEDIFASWLARDATTAISWIDGKIASGGFDNKTLDGKNHLRFRAEAALLLHLIGHDPEKAGDRLSALPEAHRASVFSNAGGSRLALSGDELAAYADLVRSHHPETRRIEALIRPAATILEKGDRHRIDEYFETIDATTGERAIILRSTASSKFMELMRNDQLATDSIDDFRQWAASHSPDEVDRITASALRNMTFHDNIDFDRVAELALHYHQETGNDEILVDFLSHSGRNREKAKSLVEKILDPALKAKVLETFR